MLKKAFFVVVGVVIVGGLMFGSSAVHMVQDIVSSARNVGDSFVSTDAKIRHAREDVKALDKDIKGLYHDIAKEEFKCEELQSEVAAKSTALSELQVHMEILNSHLKGNSSQQFVATNGKSYSPMQVKRDLSSSLKRYKTQNLMLNALEKQLESRTAILDSAREKLEETKRLKSELMSDLEALEAEHRMNEVAKITSEFKLDNSRLSRAKESIKKLRTEIRIEGNLVNQLQTGDHIPTEAIETDNLDNVTAQYEAMFGTSETGVAKN